MGSENQFLYHSFLFGIYITFIYDMLRIFRRVIPQGVFLVSLEDMCFWTYCGMEVFLLMNRDSNGRLRWFAVLGAFVGILLYQKLVSSFVVTYVSALILWLTGRIRRLLVWAVRPFRKLFAVLRIRCAKRVAAAGGGLREAVRRLKNRLTSSGKVLTIKCRRKPTSEQGKEQPWQERAEK